MSKGEDEENIAGLVHDEKMDVGEEKRERNDNRDRGIRRNRQGRDENAQLRAAGPKQDILVGGFKQGGLRVSE